MTTLACLTHWYTSLLYVVPVVGVGGWGWWSARRVTRGDGGPDAGGGSGARSETAIVSDGPAY